MAGKAFWTVACILIAVFVMAYYVTTRATQAAQFQHMTSLEQIANAKPVECEYPVGGYGTGSAGQMFIYQNELRVNVNLLDVTGFSGDMQAALNTDGTRTIDSDSLNAAGGATNAANVLNALITQAPWSCTPWWFPDNSALQVPNAVNF